MEVITATGFYGTGSSAITDLLSDCDNVECKGDYEIRILHDPYGISDLEYNLIENPNRHNTSNAIKKFKWNVDFLSGKWWNKRYEKYFDGKFKKYSYEYIENISEFIYNGKWHWDIVERGYTFWLINRCYNKFFSVIKKIFHIKNEVNHNLLPKNEKAYAGIDNEELFLKNTNKYMNKLLNAISTKKDSILCVDQLVPPSNFTRYSRYVKGIKIFVVDRDPRDIYLLEKKVWKGNIVPCYDVETFCKWYRWTRRMYEKSVKTENVMKIQFEDLIYDYENTLDKVLKFAKIEKTHYNLNHFDPNKSILNTKLWEKYPEYYNDISYIAKHLSEYCYKY